MHGRRWTIGFFARSSSHWVANVFSLQNVGSVVPGLEPLGIDLLAVSTYTRVSTYHGVPSLQALFDSFLGPCWFNCSVSGLWGDQLHHIDVIGMLPVDWKPLVRSWWLETDKHLEACGVNMWVWIMCAKFRLGRSWAVVLLWWWTENADTGAQSTNNSSNCPGAWVLQGRWSGAVICACTSVR
jgi:hypothetical protein